MKFSVGYCTRTVYFLAEQQNHAQKGKYFPSALDFEQYVLTFQNKNFISNKTGHEIFPNIECPKKSFDQICKDVFKIFMLQ